MTRKDGDEELLQSHPLGEEKILSLQQKNSSIRDLLVNCRHPHFNLLMRLSFILLLIDGDK